MADFLNDLNDKQREGATQTEGPTLIIAGAGSGKTRVLTYRVAQLMQQDVDTFRIMCLTFTNKAAREMRERIEKLVGTNARDLWMGTFHSIFARILRFDGNRLGYESNFTIYDVEDSKSLLKSIIKELNLDDKLYKPGAIFSRISSAKNSLISPQAYQEDPVFYEHDLAARRPETGKIYQIYANRCFRANAMDFDDLLYQTNVLFRDHPDILHKYQHRFRYLLIDEFQDTNISQYLIVKRLSAVHQNICVVGDDAQSIYAFRGADIRNILNFERDYPDLKTIKLEQNYRSTQNIVKAANSLIVHNRNQLHKEVWTSNAEGEKIAIIKAGTDSEEARLVATSIFEQRNLHGLPFNDFAVLYRTNAQSRALEEAMRRANIRYRIIGGLSFYQRKEIKDIIAYLRMAVNPQDEEAIKRSINNPKRGLGNTTMNKVLIASRAHDVAVWEVVRAPDKFLKLPTRTVNVLESYATMIEAFGIAAKEKDAYTVASLIAKESGLVKMFFDDDTLEGKNRYENVQELLNATREFVDNPDNENKKLSDFLQEVSLITSGDEASEDEDAVTMMTIHAAKGLEFPHVYAVGMEEELFPSSRMLESREDLEEERRLFYVAITRAKQRLTLSYALQRYMYGNLRPCEPSRFLYELEPTLLNTYQPGRASGAAVSRDPITNFIRHQQERKNKQNVTDATKPIQNKHFQPDDYKEIEEDMRVEHPKFGIGTVKMIDRNHTGRRALIDFDKVGDKTLILSFAKLRIHYE
ncbi:MAG: UvrD-helicase domain-containing protein [Bernardetiaceae bacterium]|nr:UvrD-helicase domain-containing protein [Bernardetiaceae bacterium]